MSEDRGRDGVLKMLDGLVNMQADMIVDEGLRELEQNHEAYVRSCAEGFLASSLDFECRLVAGLKLGGVEEQDIRDLVRLVQSSSMLAQAALCARKEELGRRDAKGDEYIIKEDERWRRTRR